MKKQTLLATCMLVSFAGPLVGATQGQVSEWILDPEPVTAVGVLDGPEAEMFAQVYDATLFSDGAIAVLDTRAVQVRVFSAAGEVISVFGRRGDGPGEFRGPFGVEASGDTILLWDFAKAVMMRWSRDGELLNQVRAEHPRTIHEGALLSDGSLIIPFYGPYEAPAQGKYRSPANLIRYQGSDSQDLGSFPYQEMLAGSRSGEVVPFVARSVAAAGGDPIRIAVVDDTNIPSVRIYDQSGTLVETLQTVDLRRRVDDEVWEAALAPSRARFGRRNPAFEQKLLDWGRPELTPAMSDIAVDDRGRVWLVHESADGMTAYVHDGGAVVGRLVLPSLQRIFEIKGNQLVGLRRGEYGVESVAVYRFAER